MSAPQYFLPRVNLGQLAPQGELNRELLTARGLSGVLADVRSLRETSYSDLAGNGPGGLPGIVLTALPMHGEPPRRIGFHPRDEHLVWTPIADGQSLWICIDRTAPPTPADLARHATIEGYAVKLADGHEWTVPVVRRWLHGGTKLPRDFGWDVAGNFVETMKPGYEDHWEHSAKTADFFYNGASLDIDWAVGTCVDALAINYRFGRAEQCVMKLVDSGNWRQVLGATVDRPLVLAVLAEEERKKKASGPDARAAPPSCEPGSPDE